jgi:hypothetical protein
MKACALFSHNELLESHINHVPNTGWNHGFFFNFNFCDFKKLAKFSNFLQNESNLNQKKNFKSFPIFLKKGWIILWLICMLKATLHHNPRTNLKQIEPLNWTLHHI